MSSTDEPLPAGLDEILRAIEAELPGLRQEVRDLRESEEKLRERELPAMKRKEVRLTRWAVAAFAVALVALGAVGILGYVAARQNSDRIAAEARNAYDMCVSANKFRAEDLASWKRVLPVALPAAPEWQAKRAEILAAERAKDTPRDCAKLSAAHSPPGAGRG